METMTRKQYPDRNAPIAADHLIPNAVPELVDPIAWRRLTVSSLNVAIYILWLCRETTEQNLYYHPATTMNNNLLPKFR